MKIFFSFHFVQTFTQPPTWYGFTYSGETKGARILSEKQKKCMHPNADESDSLRSRRFYCPDCGLRHM